VVKDFAAIHFLEQDVAGEIQYLKYVGMLVSCWLDPLVTSFVHMFGRFDSHAS